MELCSSNVDELHGQVFAKAFGPTVALSAAKPSLAKKDSFLKHGLVFAACDWLLRIPYVSLSSVFFPA